MKNFEELVQYVQHSPSKKNAVLVAAHDEHSLEAIYEAYEKGLVEPIYIGDKEKILAIAAAHGFHIDEAKIIDEKEDVAAAKKAVDMVNAGEVDVIMKGKIQTADLLKQVVNKEYGLKEADVMSHVGVFEVPGYPKLMVITDAGMLPTPTLEQKVKITENAINVVKKLGVENPKIAAMAAAEIENVKIQASVEAAELKRMNQAGAFPGCMVEGPISYDLVVSKESAEIKGYESPVTGDADILVVPDMTAGNLLAKALLFSGGSKLAGIIVGAKVPIVLTSRGSSSEEKFFSIALAAAVSGN